jgi:hypothetical protein
MSDFVYFLTDDASHALMDDYNVHPGEDKNTKYAGLTLGAYRRGRFPRVSPGGVVQFWSPCARPIHVFGEPKPWEPKLEWPHAYFMSTRVDRRAPSDLKIYQDESYYCPSCREDLKAHHAAIMAGTPQQSPLAVTEAPRVAPSRKKPPKVNPNQGSLF